MRPSGKPNDMKAINEMIINPMDFSLIMSVLVFEDSCYLNFEKMEFKMQENLTEKQKRF